MMTGTGQKEDGVRQKKDCRCQHGGERGGSVPWWQCFQRTGISFLRKGEKKWFDRGFGGSYQNYIDLRKGEHVFS